MKDSTKTITNDREISYKEIVIIGNGPSGITLSFILSGNWCYYNGRIHPDDMLTARLRSMPQEKSLIEQDLEFLSQGLEGRSRNPVAVLLDSLNHPFDDQDLQKRAPELLAWKHHPQKYIDHVVVGKGNPGGCWHQLDENVTTVSVSSWMELPGLSFDKWESKQCNMKVVCSCSDIRPPRRVKIKQVAKYYRDYVQLMKLSKNFKNFSYVTSIKPIKDKDMYEHILSSCRNEDVQFWEVQGYDVVKKKCFTYVCRKVVLATGTSDAHSNLNVPGEFTNTDWIFHDLKQFQNAVVEMKRNQRSAETDPILIVGSGLSAADAILKCSQFDHPILHVFNSYKFLNENNFPKNLYPEYNHIYKIMKKDIIIDTYKPLMRHVVKEIYSSIKGKRVQIVSPDGVVSWHKVSLIVILVGYVPKLTFLPPEFDAGNTLGIHENQPIDSIKNPIRILPWSYEVANSPPGLYAMGPLVGDNVVRLIHGGAVAIANHLCKRRRK